MHGRVVGRGAPDFCQNCGCSVLEIPVIFSVAIQSAGAMGAWQFRVCTILLLLTILAATQVHLVPSSVNNNRTTLELFLKP